MLAFNKDNNGHTKAPRRGDDGEPCGGKSEELATYSHLLRGGVGGEVLLKLPCLELALDGFGTEAFHALLELGHGLVAVFSDGVDGGHHGAVLAGDGEGVLIVGLVHLFGQAVDERFLLGEFVEVEGEGVSPEVVGLEGAAYLVAVLLGLLAAAVGFLGLGLGVALLLHLEIKNKCDGWQIPAESLLYDGHADGGFGGDDVAVLVGHVLLGALALHGGCELLTNNVF